jgi:hypothetical protein
MSRAFYTLNSSFKGVKQPIFGAVWSDDVFIGAGIRHIRSFLRVLKYFLRA